MSDRDTVLGLIAVCFLLLLGGFMAGDCIGLKRWSLNERIDACARTVGIDRCDCWIYGNCPTDYGDPQRNGEKK